MTHTLTTTMENSELLFEYAELFAQNPQLDGAQLARREIIRHALYQRSSVPSATLNAALVAVLLAACDVETARHQGSASTILQAKCALHVEIQAVESSCFT